MQTSKGGVPSGPVRGRWSVVAQVVGNFLGPVVQLLVELAEAASSEAATCQSVT